MDLKGASEALTQGSVLDTDASDLRIVKLLDKTLPQDDVDMVLGDGSVMPADTSAIATFVDFDFPGEARDDGLLLPAVKMASDLNGNAVTGQVTFGGSITLQNVLNDVHTFEFSQPTTEPGPNAGAYGFFLSKQPVPINNTDWDALGDMIALGEVPAIQTDFGLLLPY